MTGEGCVKCSCTFASGCKLENKARSREETAVVGQPRNARQIAAAKRTGKKLFDRKAVRELMKRTYEKP